MQKLAEICIKRPVFASMLILALVVVGVASYMRLGVDRLPAVDMPTVTVRTTLLGASPEVMETQIVQKIENAINTVEGIEEMRSVCGLGNSFIMVTFSLNRDIDVATQDIRDRVATVIKDLPDETDPPIVSKMDNDSDPVLRISISGNRSMRELTELADKIIRPQLERSQGVGQVWIDGGLSRAINIWVDPDRLAAYELPVTAVRDAVARQNFDSAGGNVTGASRESVLRTLGRYTDPAEFNDLVVTTINNQPIRIKDVGRAEDGTKEIRSVTRLNGVPTVTLNVRRQSKANTVEVIEAVKAKLAQLAEQVPADVKLEIIRDQSRYIYSALHEINTHLILGSIFASLVVLAFMRNWRSTIIASIAIPASVIATFGMMWALHFTLNSVTMLALVLMVGVVIDDAIVVLENIFRFVEEKKMTAMQAAGAATKEIGLAVLATTLSLVVIFIPVSFMSSISGRFLYQFGITAAVAVMVSLLVSFSLTPTMSARMLRAKNAGHGNHDLARSRRGFYHVIDILYSWLLGISMRHRWFVTVVALAVIGSSVPLYRMVKQDFLPSDIDEGEFYINITGPEGLSLPAMDSVVSRIEKEVRQVTGVRLVLTTVGGGFLGNLNNGNIFIGLEPHETRVFSLGRLWRDLLAGHPRKAFEGNYSQTDVMQAIRKIVAKYEPMGFRGMVRNFAAFNIGGGNFDVDFVLRGPDLQKLYEYADRLRLKTKELGGFSGADITLRVDKPELRVQIDRNRAAELGIDARDIGTALNVMVGGEKQVSLFHDWSINEDYDVDVRLEPSARSEPGEIPNLYLPSKKGGLVQLANIARVDPAKTASRIDRIDRQRAVNLRSGILPGYALGDRLEALRAAAAELNLPPEYTTRVAGRGRELERTFVEFLWAFLLSIIFMYLILASNYESVIHPFTILLSLPLTVPFALFSLWATGGTLNLYSALGILVLFGVVKKNAILQIDHMNNLRRQGMPRFEAIMQANRDRLRPILMTTLALVAGMLPLAIGTGPGAEERRAVAIVVIGGQTLSLLLTLLVTPVAYSIFDDIGALLFGRRRHAKEELFTDLADEPLSPAAVPVPTDVEPPMQAMSAPAPHIPAVLHASP